MEPTPTRTRRRRTITLILATALVVAPATAFATGGFNDVETSDFFSNAVGWMADNGVTAGCNPPSNTRYCPDDFVTRGQMAVFLERLDTQNVFLRPGDVSTDGADAETLDGIDSTGFLRSNGKATNADKLDGLNSTDFLRSNGTATNADKLDGLDATAFGGRFWESTSGATLTLSATCQNYLSVTVTVPSDGIVDVRAEANMRIDHDSGQPDSAVIYLSDIGPASCIADGSMINSFLLSAEVPTGTHQSTQPISDFFEVSAGTHTFYLNGDDPSGGTSRFWFGRLQATFHPLATAP